MKTTVITFIAVLLFGFFAFVVGEEKPLAEQPATAATKIEAAGNPTSPQTQQLLKLREKIGSQLKGRLLEDDPEASQKDFAQALEKVEQSEQETEQAVAPAAFKAPQLQLEIPSSKKSSTITVNRLADMMRHTSMALDQRAGHLEIIKDFENAQKLRKQAKKLRKKAFLVDSLNIDSATISVERQ